jgi:glycosyltransferase involved in cell wall biosynthesis
MVRSRPSSPTASKRGGSEPHHLVFLGYYSARKGVSELLEAMATPVLAALPWRATLAGGGPVDEYRANAAAVGLAYRVTCPGWIDQPTATALRAAADILMLPSHAEGLAMSALEGLAHALAVVVTPIGAPLEAVEPEQSGLLVRWARRSAASSASGAARTRAHQRARQHFCARFDVRSYSRQMRRLHAGLLGGRRLPGGIETEPLS